MSKFRETRLDTEKILDKERIRINLLLASLYLSAFEILKNSIIEGTYEFLVDEEEISDEEANKWQEVLDPAVVLASQKRYREELREYERVVGVLPGQRDRLGLIPSCQWLQGMNVLTEDEVDEIRNIRDHRNEIAHELPDLLVGQGLEIDIDRFQRIRELLVKVDTFRARSTLLFEVGTLEEIDARDLKAVMSGGALILEVIVDAVAQALGDPNEGI
jgi:hypothetical protein